MVLSLMSPHFSASASPGLTPAYARTLTRVASACCSAALIASTPAIDSTNDLTPKQAREKLEEELVKVRTEHRKKQKPITLERFARKWIDDRDDEDGQAGALKRSTRAGYRLIIETHLIPALGRRQLAAIDVAELERYIAAKRTDGLGPRTINRHLNLLHRLYAVAEKRGLARVNPARLVERPREPRRRWRILTPGEIGRVERAFRELGDDAWTRQARVIFLTVVGAGLRRGEIRGLLWCDVALADPDGARLRVRETWVCGGRDTPKSEKSERTIALGKVLAEELTQHLERTLFKGDDERVFSSATGGPLDPGKYAETYRTALKKAGITDYVRPFHDGRHTSITNAAAAGTPPAALMARAGHSDFATTQLYIDLAGETFREEAERLEERVFGHNVRHDADEPPVHSIDGSSR
jgi:integrase